MPEQELKIGTHEIEVEPVKQLEGGGARVDIEADDRKWRVDVTSNGEKKAILTTWRDGQLADLDEPDWLEDVLARLGRAA